MSTHDEQPLSRRAAREAAERAAREAAAVARPAEPAPRSAPYPPPSAAHAPSGEPAQGMRRRDFRPPSEQESPRSFALTVEEDAPLEYRTERPVTPSPSHHVAEPSPGARQPSVPHVISEHTLSRRELRSLRDAGEPTAPPASAPEHHTLPSPAHHTQAPAPLAPSAPVPPPLVEPQASPGDVAASTSSAPTGSHWSVGAHDDEDPFANTFSREVGSGTHSTNALVLPQMPESNLSGPVTGTGELIVTGMIEMPRILASTGATPLAHDSAEVDDYIEPGDVELASSNAAPVSALRAVSGHTSPNSMMSGKPQRNSSTLTTVLVASTVVMAVVAIGLFVLAAVNGLF